MTKDTGPEKKNDKDAATCIRFSPKHPPKPSLTDFWNYAEAWLRVHFGKFLGDEGILKKTAAILSTIFILLFNYLKHQFDVGYYHDVFGVPEAYLGAAWNSTMTDFVLNALVSILQSFLGLCLVAVVGLALFRLLDTYVFKDAPDASHKIYRHPIGAAIVSIVCIIGGGWLAARLRTIGRFFLLFCAAIGGGMLLFVVVFVMYNAYLNCHKKKHSLACDNKECSDDTCTAKVCPTETNVKKDYYTYLREKKDPKNNENENNDNNKNDPGLSVIQKVFLFLALLILLFAISGFANLLGGCIASLETELSFLPADESLSQQLDNLSCDLPGDYWAVLYRKGEQYVIMPCHIDEDEATVYPQYHCVVPTEGTVIAEKSFRRILIDDNTLMQGEEWNLLEVFLRIFHVDDSILQETITPTIPDGTTEPTIPDDTEPTIPDDTTEPTIPDGTTDTSISYDVTELHISSNVTELSISGEVTWPIGSCSGGCDCCRCVPGLG